MNINKVKLSLWKNPNQFMIEFSFVLLCLSIGADTHIVHQSFNWINIGRICAPIISFCICVPLLAQSFSLRKVPFWSYMLLSYLLVLVISTPKPAGGQDYAGLFLIFQMFTTVCIFFTALTLDSVREKTLERLFFYFCGLLLLLCFGTFLTYQTKIFQTGVINPYSAGSYAAYLSSDIGSTFGLPRPTGLSRLAAILFLLSFFALQFRNSNKMAAFLCSSFFLFLIFYLQTRGTAIALIISLFAFYMILSTKQLSSAYLLFKIAALALALTIALQLSTYVAISFFSNHLEQAPDLSKAWRSSDNLLSTSGRLEDWINLTSLAFEKPFIGWGVQADRLLINQTASNAVIYVFACAGVSGLFFCFLVVTKIFLSFFRNTQNSQRQEPVNLLTFTLFIFLLVRSLFETSVAIFGIDFILLMFIAAQTSSLRVKTY